MKDLLIRTLASVVVGAIVSAGILYFAFDQALRGLETAVNTTNQRIGDNLDAVQEVRSTLSARR